jgi:hypothetical protein
MPGLLRENGKCVLKQIPLFGRFGIKNFFTQPEKAGSTTIIPIQCFRQAEISAAKSATEFVCRFKKMAKKC